MPEVLSHLPYFIQHSDHSELKVKIQTLKKADPPFSWVECEEKSLSLNGQATGRLLYELNRLQAVSDENELGSLNWLSLFDTN
jgi:hypothetical protein